MQKEMAVQMPNVKGGVTQLGNEKLLSVDGVLNQSASPVMAQ